MKGWVTFPKDLRSTANVEDKSIVVFGIEGRSGRNEMVKVCDHESAEIAFMLFSQIAILGKPIDEAVTEVKQAVEDFRERQAAKEGVNA